MSRTLSRLCPLEPRFEPGVEEFGVPEPADTAECWGFDLFDVDNNNDDDDDDDADDDDDDDVDDEEFIMPASATTF